MGSSYGVSSFSPASPSEGFRPVAKNNQTKQKCAHRTGDPNPPLNVLTFSTLYPNEARPVHGIFVERRLLELVKTRQVQATVVAPVPWFPFSHESFGEYATFARVPGFERRRGMDVHHPRFPVIPKVGMNFAPYFLYWTLRPFLRKLLRNGPRIDLIDAHYFYPDGVAAVMLARHFGLPVVVTGRGTDLNRIPDFSIPRRLIAQAAARADGLITVTQALKDVLVQLGMADRKVQVLRNGVDLEHFRPLDRQQARKKLGMRSGTWLLSVGLLDPRKAHHRVIEALADLPDVNLMIVGEGPERARLSSLTRVFSLEDRVHFAGLVSPEELPLYYSAADLFVLASEREGWANVLLEAMACGTPIVASDIPGTREVITGEAPGKLFDKEKKGSLPSAVKEMLANPPSRELVRAHAERFGWQETTESQLSLFFEIVWQSARNPG